MASPTEDLRGRLAVLADLGAAGSLLGWDRDTMMPPRGADARGEVQATLDTLIHELLAGAGARRRCSTRRRPSGAAGRGRRDRPRRAPRPRPRDADPRRADVRDGAHDRGGAARLGGRARGVGLRRLPPAPRAPGRAARARSRRASPRSRIPYDALLEDREPGTTTAAVVDVFAELRDGLVPLIAEIAEHARRRRRSRGRSRTPASARSALDMARAIGYDDAGWRLDDSTHPFSMVVGPGDQRVTARWDDADLSGIFAVLHEVGHGLYEQQIDPSLRRTTLDAGVSFGVHESQSRLWENQVGRSRAFWSHWLPRAQQALPSLGGLGPRRVPAQRERRAPDADPRRGRRGDVRAPRDPALPARAGADGGHARRRRHPGRVERRDARPARHHRPGRRATAACRTSTGRSASSATSRPTRSATS